MTEVEDEFQTKVLKNENDIQINDLTSKNLDTGKLHL